MIGIDTVLLGLAALSVVGLWLLYGSLVFQAFPPFWSLLDRRSTPICCLKVGPVEVSGKLFADEPFKNHRGQRCAILEAEIHSEWEAGTFKMTQERRMLFLAPGLTLRDASGQCRIVATSDEISLSSDPVRRVYEPYLQESLLRVCPQYRSLVTPGAKVTLIERQVRVKGRVVVTGHALPDETAEPLHYREGANVAWKLTSSPDQRLMLSRGTQGQTFARLSGPLLLGFAIVGAVGHLAWSALRLALAF
jgi:hypothetical protein